jgi:hypothetical protein
LSTSGPPNSVIWIARIGGEAIACSKVRAHLFGPIALG